MDQLASFSRIARFPGPLYGATTDRIVVTMTVLTRKGDTLDGRLFGATPTHFVKE